MKQEVSTFGKPKTLWELCEQTVEAILTRPTNYSNTVKDFHAYFDWVRLPEYEVEIGEGDGKD